MGKQGMAHEEVEGREVGEGPQETPSGALAG